MQYFIIDRQTLQLEVIRKKPDCGYAVPLMIEPSFRELSALERVIYYEILYPTSLQAPAKQYKVHGQYKLFEPDPWMVAIAWIMWEGVVQGFAWDIVKVSVASALEKLRGLRAAPEVRSKPVVPKPSVDLEFHWASYATNRRKTYQMFIRLRRIYQGMADEQKHAVTRSLYTDPLHLQEDSLAQLRGKTPRPVARGKKGRARSK